MKNLEFPPWPGGPRSSLSFEGLGRKQDWKMAVCQRTSLVSWTPKVCTIMAPKTTKNSPKGHDFTYFGGPGLLLVSWAKPVKGHPSATDAWRNAGHISLHQQRSDVEPHQPHEPWSKLLVYSLVAL